MILTTADECRELLRAVAAAMFDGEEAEPLLAAAVGADRPPRSDTGTAMAALKRLKARVEGRHLASSALANADRAAAAVASFARRLDALPDAVDIDAVGRCTVVGIRTRNTAPNWSTDLVAAGGAITVFDAVRAALADLRGAVMRLELAISRLG